MPPLIQDRTRMRADPVRNFKYQVQLFHPETGFNDEFAKIGFMSVEGIAMNAMNQQPAIDHARLSDPESAKPSRDLAVRSHVCAKISTAGAAYSARMRRAQSMRSRVVIFIGSRWLSARGDRSGCCA